VPFSSLCPIELYRIDEFKAETEKAGNKLKNKYEQEVVVLEQKNIELKRKLSEYKYDGKDKWQQFKLELNDEIEVDWDTQI